MVDSLLCSFGVTEQKNVDDLADLLRPSWGSEQWIKEGWETISDEDKNSICVRVNTLFKDGLPLKLEHDKIIYIYAFSLLAQLEVLAIQVPLKFRDKMSTAEYRERMHQQLLDEIFHGIVFTKILYLLCAPNAIPPAYNENVELLCNFIRQEECPKVALMLLNLIGEGWIEEIFYSLQKANIAPAVFAAIIDDEHRHVCEAELYKDIGVPDLNLLRPKLRYLEEQLITNVFMQYQYMFAMVNLLGVEGAIAFNQSLHNKHQQQLEKINLEPSENWQFFMDFAARIYPRMQSYAETITPVPFTHLRRLFLTQWDDPTDPTMVGDFFVDVSAVDFFAKKFPAETLTTIMMQAISTTLTESDSFRNFLSQNKIYQSLGAYVGVVVKLPECGDHLGTIVFDHCHNLTAPELAQRVRNIIKLMVYCYKKREFLEQQHPGLEQMVDKLIYEYNNGGYPYPIPGSSIVSVSNIGFCGYTGGKSPLRRNESLKFTLMEVVKKPVWDDATQAFIPRDMLPVSISADHRIFDGNLPIPKMIIKNFQRMFAKMLADLGQPLASANASEETQFIKMLDQIILANLEMGYKILLFLQTYWFDFIAIEEIMSNDFAEKATSMQQILEDIRP